MSDSRVSEAGVQCKNCGLAVVQSRSLFIEQRMPCTQCGSISRVFDVRIRAAAIVEGHLGYRMRSPGKGKWKRKEHGGDSFFRKDWRWHRLVRILDRTKNWYYEHITDAKTGDVVRHCEEPLSQHRKLSKAMGPGPATIGAKPEGRDCEPQ
jgi:hypothetical protein